MIEKRIPTVGNYCFDQIDADCPVRTVGWCRIYGTWLHRDLVGILRAPECLEDGPEILTRKEVQALNAGNGRKDP